jgi:hypothetical protein
MVAYAFLTKIGARNVGFIKSLTVAMPFRGGNRGPYGELWNPDTEPSTLKLYSRMPFPYPGMKVQHRRCFPRLDFEEEWCKLA